jgi:cytosolic carboxypeptidase protein 6
MRGDLVFNSAFESGNLQSAKRLSRLEWDLRIRPDTNNDKHRLWFYFKVSNVEKNQLVLFTISNMSKGRSSYREGMSPLVKSTHRPTWQRIPPGNVVYYRVPRTRSYNLSFFFQFDESKDTYYFAYSYPYTYTDLQKYLHLVDAAAYPFYSRSLLCRTLQHRRVDLITITNPIQPSQQPSQRNTDTDDDDDDDDDVNRKKKRSGAEKNNTQKNKKKHVIVLSARIHPGDYPPLLSTT